MDKFEIFHSPHLEGIIEISGSKNASLPIIIAGILSDQDLHLTNVPNLTDVRTAIDLLRHLGAEVDSELLLKNELKISGHNIVSHVAPYEIVSKMRASVLVLGPLLARFGVARVSMPGGCSIGLRPIDLYTMALKQLGAQIELRDGYIEASCPTGLKGAEIDFPLISVGATETAIMGAVLARGQTIITGAATEPEVQDLCAALVAMGARIAGCGTHTITIDGVSALRAAHHAVSFDRIEATTYAIAALITDGCLKLHNAPYEECSAVFDVLAKAGGSVRKINDRTTEVKRATAQLSPVDVVTAPYPGFPTDAQQQLMAMLSLANGRSTIKETMFDNRFMHVMEMCRLGARIAVHNDLAVIDGVEKLQGSQVMSSDLRASAALILAGLAARGRTVVSRIYHLDRGYEHMETKLAQCGARIARLK